jgi:hypothetical protein
MSNTIQTKCIQKFRDKSKKIYGYRLVDLNGQTQDVKSEDLKLAIRKGEVNVVNLTLTANDRLVDTSEKQLQSKQLGGVPKEDDVTALAKALVFIGLTLTDVDTYGEVVKMTCSEAGLKANTSGLNQEQLEELETKAYKILIKRRDIAIHSLYMDLLDDDYEYYPTIKEAMYDENVSSLSDSKTYKSLCLIYKYFCEVDKKLAKEIKTKLLDDMKQNGVASIRLGTTIGNQYYKYLDENIFKWLSNDAFTVGHIITTEEKKQFKELKPFTYMMSKDYGGLSPRPEVGPTFLFRNGDNGKVIVEVKMFRKGYTGEHAGSVVGYIKDIETFELDPKKSDKANVKVFVSHCNKVGKEIKEFAEKNPSLMQMLSLGAEIEKF